MKTELYNFAYDEDTATFWLTDFSGRIVGFSQYRPSGQKKNVNSRDEAKYFTYLTKGTNGLFGIESLHYPGPIYLVGGIFKALTLHRLGFPALHVSSASYRWLKPQLRLLNRKFLALGDADNEGQQFVKRYGGAVCPKDLDEMKDRDVLAFIKNLN